LAYRRSARPTWVWRSMRLIHSGCAECGSIAGPKRPSGSEYENVTFSDCAAGA
jgi:hypothetical protein